MKILRAGSVAVAVVAFGIALSGCGSETTAGEATTASNDTTTTEEPTSEAETSPAQASGPNYTIVDYIRDENIGETVVRRGDPGTPTVNLPFPPDWADAGESTPEEAWSATVSTDPAFEADPPSIIALMSKLTGNVDPAKVLEYAPNEIKNLPGFEGGDGSSNTLAGFDAVQIGGVYVKDGTQRMIAQKTVVIPGQDGLYVLQLNADGLEDQMTALLDAAAMIDEQTTITP